MREFPHGFRSSSVSADPIGPRMAGSAPAPSAHSPSPADGRLPPFRIIQGGMGAGVSGWALARAVAMKGQLGVVSGTGLDALFARRLQDGDPSGRLRRAIEHFPVPGIADEILRKWFRPGGREPGEPYKAIKMDGRGADLARQRLIVAANFVEVWLAREGHDGAVGVNLLTKIQMPNLPSLYGAMLAGVHVVLMGAGIPREIPAVLDALAEGRAASIRMEVDGLRPDESPYFTFDPADHGAPAVLPPTRPAFFPIISSNLLATMMVRKASGRIDGFVIEGPTAGGHNAPPRGELKRNARGEPVYGERDVVDLRKVADLGLPFWLAGGTGWPDKLRMALEDGAAGVQVGTLFAYSNESGLDPGLKANVIARALEEQVDIYTDADASPTGFPFKVVRLAGSLSEEGPYLQRERVCDLGYLRAAYPKPSGSVGFRCPSEPVDIYVSRGGDIADTVGRKCLCNALMANVSVAQLRDGGVAELPLLTSGDDLRELGRFLAGRREYAASDVLDHLLG